MKKVHIGFIIFLLISFIHNILYAAGNADVTISTSATANGTWSGLSGGTYTFTPSANTAVVNITELQNRLLGSGITAGNVTILTACSGTGSQTGNVTISNSITAATTGRTFRITAAGTISVNAAINLTGAASSNGGIINFSGTAGITVGAAITTTGGTAGTTATSGYNAGTIGLTSSSGGVTVNAAINALGTVAGTSGSGGGGSGGAITISGSSFTSNTSGAFNTSGGAGRGGAGGSGGAVSITSTGAVNIAGSFTTIGANMNTTGSTGIGGPGGALSISGTSVSITAGGINTTGGKGSGSGGNGGNVTISSSSTSVSITPAITTTGGQTGTSVNGSSGGNGGVVNITSTTTMSVGNITASGGYNNHAFSCMGNGANVNLTATTITKGTITNSKGGTVTLDPSNSGCSSKTNGAQNICENPSSGTITTPTAICSGASTAIDGSTVSGVSYEWQKEGTLNAGNWGANIATTEDLAAGTVGALSTTTRFRRRTTVCSASKVSAWVIVTVTVNSRPTVTFTAQAGASVCANTDVTYTTESGQSNYVWTVPGVLNTNYSITSGGVGTSSNTVTLKWLTITKFSSCPQDKR